MRIEGSENESSEKYLTICRSNGKILSVIASIV